MKRRDFLTFKSNDVNLLNIQNDLSDKKTEPLTKKEAMHLFGRISFGNDLNVIQQIAGKTPDEAIDLLLGKKDDSIVDGYKSISWLDTQEEDPLDGLPLDIRFEIEGILKSRFRELKDWWLQQMFIEDGSFHEKLTLFLSTIWCIEFTYDQQYLLPPALLYRNNKKLRENRIGNYKTIAKEMTLDGAMLLYQSLNYSTAKAPNENFMRELLELFTMGIGNYTEGDIREGSKVLTGWRIAAYKYQPAPNEAFNVYFSRNDHHKGAKRVFNVDFPAIDDADNYEEKVKENEVYRLIDVIFQERGTAIAKFICEKIFRFFVYSSPADVDNEIIAQMADTFIKNDFELLPVYKQLFSSRFFYSSAVVGSQIKTPQEFIIGLQKMFAKEFKSGNAKKSREACEALEMELYDPPNVGSWAAYRSWISTTTYPNRYKYAKEYLTIFSDKEILDFGKKFSNYQDANLLLNDFIDYFFPIALSTERKERYKTVMLNEIPENEWANSYSSSSSKVVAGLRNLFNEIVLSPDFNLC